MATEITLKDVLENEREHFNLVCTDKHMNFDREAAFAFQIISNNDYLLNSAKENTASLRAAINNVASVGITLNPALKLAYLVPRKVNNRKTVCLDISYMGLMNTAIEAGAVKWGQAKVVYEGDVFELKGIDKPPVHVYDPYDEKRKEIKGAYVVVKTDTGDYLTHTMKIKDIYDIRDKSDMWKKKQVGPWKDFPEEMIKKTVVKQAYKYWPRRKKLDEAIDFLNTVAGEGISFSDLDEFKRGKGNIAAGGEAMKELDEAKQKEAHDLSLEIEELCNDERYWEAMDKMHDIQSYDPVPDFGTAVWWLLNSTQRANLKKYEAAARRGERPEDEE